MTTYAYVRVSTKEQNEDRQLDALENYNVPKGNLFVDKESGKDFARPAYRRLMRRLKPDDVLLIKSIDRLGRNYKEIMEQWRIITKVKRADIKVLDTPLLDTTYGKDLLGTFIADLVLTVLSYTAQTERENIKQRQAEGIESALARGVQFGRPKMGLPDGFEEQYELWRAGGITMKELAEQCGMSRSTMYKRLREYEAAELGF